MITRWSAAPNLRAGAAASPSGPRCRVPGPGTPPRGSDQKEPGPVNTLQLAPFPAGSPPHPGVSSGSRAACTRRPRPAERCASGVRCRRPTRRASYPWSCASQRPRPVLHATAVSFRSTKWVSSPAPGGWVEGGLCLCPLELPFSVVLLDPPAGLEARRADEGGHVVLRWLPPPGAPMASLIRYEVNISAGSAAGSAQKVGLAPTAHPQRSQGSSPSKSHPSRSAPDARHPFALGPLTAPRPPTRPLSPRLPCPPMPLLDHLQGPPPPGACLPGPHPNWPRALLEPRLLLSSLLGRRPSFL